MPMPFRRDDPFRTFTTWIIGSIIGSIKAEICQYIMQIIGDTIWFVKMNKKLQKNTMPILQWFRCFEKKKKRVEYLAFYIPAVRCNSESGTVPPPLFLWITLLNKLGWRFPSTTTNMNGDSAISARRFTISTILWLLIFSLSLQCLTTGVVVMLCENEKNNYCW
jgi:hypothetical protein